MKARLRLAWGIVLCLMLTAGSTALGAASTSWQRLEGLFGQAVSAEGARYYEIRDEIIADEEAVTFLRAKSLSDEVHSRVLAEAMLTWATSPGANNERRRLLGWAVAGALGRQGGLLGNIESYALGYHLPRGYTQRPDVLHEGAAVPFLSEVALKGAIPSGPEERSDPVIQGYAPSVWMSCAAAALVGGYPREDVIVILGELLSPEKVEPIRACAATGLVKSKRREAIPPLMKALSDTSESVRTPALFGVRELTGQDFGSDVSKYLEWWAQNKERLLKQEAPK